MALKKKIALSLIAFIAILLFSFAALFYGQAAASKTRVSLYFDTENSTAAGTYGEVPINFSEDIIALSDVETMRKDIAKLVKLTVKPDLKGRFKPIGSRDIVFELLEKPKPSTRYEAVLNSKSIKSLTGKPVKVRINYRDLPDEEFFFETTRFQVYSASKESKKPDSPIIVYFNFPLALDALKKELTIVSSDGKPIPYSLNYQINTNSSGRGENKITRLITNENTIVVKPSGEKKATKYNLSINSALMGKEGNLSLIKTFAYTYETYPPFRFVELDSSYHDGESIRFFPDTTILLRFNNSIQISENDSISRYVTITPKVEKPVITFDGDSIQVTANFTGGNTYRFKVSKTLTDIYQQSLDSEVEKTVDFEHFFSYFAAPPGYMVMENYLPRILPFKVRNIEKIEFRTLSLKSKEEIIRYFNDKKMVFDNENKSKAIKIKWSWDKFYNYRLDLAKIHPSKNGLLVYQAVPEIKIASVSSESDEEYSIGGSVLFSDVGMTIKRAPTEMMIVVRSLKDNQPVEGAVISGISGTESEVLGKTDRRGLLFTKKMSYSLFSAEKDESLCFSEIHAGYDDEGGGYHSTASTIYYGNNWTFDQPELLLFSDRQLYKPGEKAMIKGILRYRNDDFWTPLSPFDRSTDTTLNVKVNNSRDEELLSTALIPDSFGSLFFEVPIPADAPTGYYSVRIFNDQIKVNSYQNFRVEDFKPARAEMRIVPLKQDFVWGDTLEADLVGWYLFGAPVGKPIDYTVSISPTYYYSKRFPGYNFSSGWNYYDEEEGYYEGYRDSSKELASGTLEPDASGRVHVAVSLKKDDFKGDALVQISAKTVLDDQSTVFGAKGGLDLKNPVHVGVEVPNYFINWNENPVINLIALDNKEEIASGQPVKATVSRHEWTSFQKAGVNGRLYWEWKEIITNVFTQDLTLGRTALKIPPLTPGYYVVEAKTSVRGHEMLSAGSFYVIGAGEVGWRMNNERTVELETDKREYQVGDTARVLIKNPFQNAKALISFEREKFFQTQEIEATNSILVIPVKITEEFIPNIYVSVLLYTGRTGTNHVENDTDLERPRYLLGYANIKVVPKEKRLTVTVRPEKDKYGPGEFAKVSFEVKDSSGNPADAELTVSAADKGVLNLINYQLPDPLDFFYKPRPLAVYTSEMRDFIFGQRYLSEKGEIVGGDGGLSMGMIVPRSDIRYSAYFNPKLFTTNGRAEIEFKLPDNLSTFKIMTVAQNKKSQFGYGDALLTVQKSLMLLPTFPQFARSLDTFQAGAMVFNYTGKDQMLSISLDMDYNLTQQNGSTNALTNVFIPNNGSKEVLFNLKAGAKESGECRYVLKVLAGKESDGIEGKLPFRNPQIFEVTALYDKESAPNSKFKKTLKVTSAVIPEMSRVEASFSPSAFSGLKGNLDYLIEYPYGCLEQKSSLILPLILGEDIIIKHGLLKDKTQRDLRRIVSETLQEFPKYAGSQGFRYWPGDTYEPNPYLTVYATFVMTMAKKKGYFIPKDLFNKALEWTKAYADNRGTYESYSGRIYNILTRAFALYVSAMNGYENATALKLVYSEAQKKQYSLISAYAYVLKTASLYQDFWGKDSLIQEITKDFFGRTRTEAQTVYFSDTSDWGWFYYNNVITTSLILQALIESKTDFPEAFKVINYLIKAQKAGRWSTTHENAMVFWAYSTYLNAFEKEEPNFKAKAVIKDTEFLTALFQRRTDKTATGEYLLKADDLGSMDIDFSKDGKGTLYYYLRYKYLLKKPLPKQDMGYSLEKKISDLSTGAEITNGIYVRGRQYLVKISVFTPKERYFSVLDDQLPAGMEAVNLDFATEDNSKNIREGDDSWWGGFDHFEKYRDRALFTSRFLHPGSHSLQYVMRAVNPGNYHVPQLKAEEMYAPEVFGTLWQRDIEIIQP